MSLWALSALGALVGVWALFFPAAFYDLFPGIGMLWVSIDGPFNEHLIRDVGALYLALTAGGVTAALSRGVEGGRAISVAWAVFSVPHLVYHVDHVHLVNPLDAVAQLTALCITLLLTVPLLLPAARRLEPAP